jgi:hypothetical protein
MEFVMAFVVFYEPAFECLGEKIVEGVFESEEKAKEVASAIAGFAHVAKAYYEVA